MSSMQEPISNTGVKASVINTPKKVNWASRILKWLIILLILWLAFWIIGGTYIVVDSKFRSGNVIKFGKDGWLMRTHEGTLRMGGGEGMMNNAREDFNFSVTDKAMIEALEKVDTRKTVKLWYDKTRFALPWRGDTKYYIIKMEIMPDLLYNPVQPAPQPPVQPQTQTPANTTK
jgi:hypothetical protein